MAYLSENDIPDDPLNDFDFLWECYHEKDMSAKAIAFDIGEDKSSVSTALAVRNITKPWTNEQYLRELFVEHDLSSKEISERSEMTCSHATIRKWLDEYNIAATPSLTENELRELYCKQEMGIKSIAQKLGMLKFHVREALERFDIEVRSNNNGEGELPKIRTWEDGYERIIHTHYGHSEHGIQEIRHHRLLMAMNHSLEELKGNHVHHKNHTQWLNYEDNLEVVTPEEHGRLHGADSPNYEDDILENLPVEYRYDTTIIEESI